MGENMKWNIWLQCEAECLLIMNRENFIIFPLKHFFYFSECQIHSLHIWFSKHFDFFFQTYTTTCCCCVQFLPVICIEILFLLNLHHLPRRRVFPVYFQLRPTPVHKKTFPWRIPEQEGSYYWNNTFFVLYYYLYFIITIKLTRMINKILIKALNWRKIFGFGGDNPNFRTHVSKWVSPLS